MSICLYFSPARSCFRLGVAAEMSHASYPLYTSHHHFHSNSALSLEWARLFVWSAWICWRWCKRGCLTLPLVTLGSNILVLGKKGLTVNHFDNLCSDSVNAYPFPNLKQVYHTLKWPKVLEIVSLVPNNLCFWGFFSKPTPLHKPQSLIKWMFCDPQSSWKNNYLKRVEILFVLL